MAQLDNEMVVFTSLDMKPHIENIRYGKVTRIVTLDLNENYKDLLTRIKAVLDSEDFIKNVPRKHRQNPEYWSEKYVLVNNLKSYFVKEAINSFNLSNELVAWVDFGYCRDNTTLGDIKNWYYPFDDQYVHLFTLKKDKLFSIVKNPKFPHTKQQVLTAIFNNKPYIIGGVIVAHKKKWKIFSDLIVKCQLDLLNQNIIDDDQGVYLMCHYTCSELFKLHYLGKDAKGQPNWFKVMCQYHT